MGHPFLRHHEGVDSLTVNSDEGQGRVDTDRDFYNINKTVFLNYLRSDQTKSCNLYCFFSMPANTFQLNI